MVVEPINGGSLLSLPPFTFVFMNAWAGWWEYSHEAVFLLLAPQRPSQSSLFSTAPRRYRAVSLKYSSDHVLRCHEAVQRWDHVILLYPLCTCHQPGAAETLHNLASASLFQPRLPFLSLSLSTPTTLTPACSKECAKFCPSSCLISATLFALRPQTPTLPFTLFFC